MPLETPFASDVEACRALLAKGSKSFALAAQALPPSMRDAATVLYAFCRIADDEIDEAPKACAATIERLHTRIRRVYDGVPGDHPADRALAVVVTRHEIPIGIFEAMLEGMAWDASGRRYERLEDLHAYAARVAGTVGVMMCLLMGRRDVETLARACDLGVAMQLTNIARDVGEDGRRGRIYLPLSWLRQTGLDADALVAYPRHSVALRGVVRRLLAEAERLYRQADRGVTRLPPDCQVAIRAARLIYAEIGSLIERADFDVVSGRAVVPGWRKAWLLAQAARLGAQAPLATNEFPPLEATQFLVSMCAAAA